MKKTIFLLTFLAFSIKATAQEKVNWLSFEKAIELNKTNPKPIVIDIYTDWCGWCKKMEKSTYSNAVIIKYINENFYAIKLDGEGKEDITFKNHTFKYVKQGRTKYHELTATLMGGKLSYPSTIFISKNVVILQNIPGYITKERLEKILAFYNNENYKTKDWNQFEKEFKSSI